MARIPLYQGAQVAPDAGRTPTARQQIATPDAAFGSIQAAQAQQFARGVGSGLNAFMQAKQEADQTRVDDALNQLREAELDLTFNPETGYTNLKGVQALERPDKKPLSSEYFDKLNSRRAEILQSLGNDDQRQLFDARSNDRLTAFKGNLMNYEGDQFRSYQLSVTEGTIGTATNQVAQFYNDPDKVNDGVLSIQSSVAKQGRLQGWSAEQITNISQKQVSAAHMGAIAQAMGQGPAGVMQAEQYLRAYKDQMTPQDLLKARGVVDEKAAEVIGGAKAMGVIGQISATAQPQDMDRVINITMQTESGGRRYGKDGQLLTSPKGAKGEMQVMDGTNLDPGYGVKPARDNSPEERARVGRDYLMALVKNYNGDLASAWAAYNAGPGNVDKAKAKAAKEGRASEWMTYLPKPQETIPYVQKNLAAYRNGLGKPPTMTYEDGRNRLLADPDLQTRPLALQKALANYDTQYAKYQQGVKRSQEEAFNQALSMRQSGMAMGQLPAEVLNKVKPEDRDRLAKYDGATDLTVYQTLAANPDMVRRMSDEQFANLAADLSDADFKKFADLRGKSGSGKAGEKGAPSTLDISGISQVLKPRLQSIGLDMKKASDQVRGGAITQHLHDRILERQAQEGRQLTDAEVVKFIDTEFLRTRAFKVPGWFTHTGVRKEQLFGMKIGDIPSASKERIRADLAAQGVLDPTDQQVLQAYYEADADMPNTRR
jgi:soluble lytic murein transglycosylase